MYSNKNGRFFIQLQGDVGYHQNAVSPANPFGLNTTNGYIMTPNIDALAAQGIKLENYYVQPLCSPTRGTVMTGRYPSHTGVGPNVIRPDHPYGLPGDEVTIAQVMKSAGYATAAVGKWHLGFCDERYTPTFRGFDSYLARGVIVFLLFSFMLLQNVCLLISVHAGDPYGRVGVRGAGARR